MSEYFYLTSQAFFISALVGIVIASFSIIVGKKIKTKQQDKSLMGLLYLWKKSPLMTILLTVILGPLAEEIVFRLLSITILNIILPTCLSVIITSLAFGLMHKQYPLNIISGFMGMIFAYVFLKYGVIASSISHGLQNLIVLANLSLTVFRQTNMSITKALEKYGIYELASLLDN